jgi:hypothetical protein
VSKFTYLVALLLVAIGSNRLCKGQDLNGFIPIETRNYRDLSLPFLRLDPRPWVLDKGDRTLTIEAEAANDVRILRVGGVLKDFEQYEEDMVQARYRQGLGHGVDFTLDLPFISRGGGFLDPLLDAYHRFIGVTGGSRYELPYSQCLIEIPGSGPYRDAIGIGDIDGAITKALTPRLMGTVAIKLPTGNAGQILGSGNFDGAFDFQYKLPNGPRWCWQFQAGLVGQGTSTELQGTRGLNPQGAIVLMHKANRVDNWVFQWQTEESGIVTGVAGSDSPHRQVGVAYQHMLPGGRMFELYFTDDGDWANSYHDPEIANIAPFTLGIRYTMHL